MSKSTFEDHMVLNCSGHVVKVSFPKGKFYKQYGSLIGASGFTWEDLPQLAILTGKTGGGKTHILKYISACINRFSKLKDGEVVYINYDPEVGSDKGELDHSLKSFYEGRRDWMSSVQMNLLSKTPITDPFAKRVSDYIRTNHIETDGGSESILAIAQEMMFSKDLSDPVKTIISACEQYERLYESQERAVYIGKYESLTEEKALEREKLYKCYLANKASGGSTASARISEEEFFRDSELVTKTLQETLGEHPTQEINNELKKFGYKYSISYTADRSAAYKTVTKLEFIKGASKIDYDSLSSGEKMTLKLISILHHNRLRSATDGLKILLLDEFDSHFDPELCRKFLEVIKSTFLPAAIQVILSTHRLDTVALSPDDSVFIVDNEDKELVRKTHRLEAMFNMSGSVKSLLDAHHKVYTEGVRDAEFYEAVYSSLRKYSDEYRESMEDLRAYEWRMDEDFHPRLLSRRYELTFNTTSTIGNGGGSCQAVKEMVLRDRRALEVQMSLEKEGKSSLKKHMFSEAKLYHSYGIIDGDGHKEGGHGLSKHELTKVVTVLPRYGIENFIFDPVILAQEVRKIKALIKLFKSPDFSADLIKHLCNLNSGLSSRDYAKAEEEICILFDLYFDAIESGFIRSMIDKATKTKRPSEKQKELKAKVEAEDEICLGDILEVANEEKEDNIKKTAKLLFEARSFGIWANIVKISVIVSSNKVISFSYPKFFTDIAGHGLEKYIFSEEFADQVVQLIKRDGLKYIPADLAGVFFNLDSWVREDVRSVIKPAKEGVGGAEESKVDDAHIAAGRARAEVSEVIGDRPSVAAGAGAPLPSWLTSSADAGETLSPYITEIMGGAGGIEDDIADAGL